MSSYFSVKEHIVPSQYIREYPGATFRSQEDNLKLHVKQYIPAHCTNPSPGAVTIIGAHANAFPKELYEPMWEALCLRLHKQGQEVRSVWIADVTHQGESGSLNMGRLGNDPSWHDHARDLLHMINLFRKEMPRPLIGVGHSMGATALVNLSLLHPRLLSALALIDPVILSKSASRITSAIDGENPTLFMARLSTFRRDWWPSRAEAAASFKQSRFYQKWDPRVLDLWIEYGLREVSPGVGKNEETGSSSKTNQPVMLSTGKGQEVFTFLRPTFNRAPVDGPDAGDSNVNLPDRDPEVENDYPFYRAEPPLIFEQLPYLRPPAMYLFGGMSAFSGPESRRDRVERTGIGVGGSGGVKLNRVRERVLKEGGHLMPMEQVEEVAETVSEFLVDELERWRKEEAEWSLWWQNKDSKDKMMITKEWEHDIGGDPRADGLAKGKL